MPAIGPGAIKIRRHFASAISFSTLAGRGENVKIGGEATMDYEKVLGEHRHVWVSTGCWSSWGTIYECDCGAEKNNGRHGPCMGSEMRKRLKVDEINYDRWLAAEYAKSIIPILEERIERDKEELRRQKQIAASGRV